MRILTALFSILTVFCFGQNATKHSFTFEKGATVNMSAEMEDWNIHLQHLEAPTPGISGLRAELHQKKLQIMEMYPAQASGSARAASGPTPNLGNNFEGNTFQGIPNDNDMAISKDSIVVSVTNSRIHMYNGVTEEQVFYRSLGGFVQPLHITGSKFDPKVIYDPQNDRFIIIFLSGFTNANSHIMVAFSKTSDPTGDWNLYALPGNPLNNDTWSDYPVVGISGKDLYIGVNTFTDGSSNNSGFTESCLWQIGLRQGYLGYQLITNYYSDILPWTRRLFNITPMPAADVPSAENMYLISNRNTAIHNDSIFLLEVTGRVTDPNTELVLKTLVTDQPYVLPVPARQGGGQWFDTNDSRILGGYVLNGRIHFVQSCTDPSTGTSGIYHGVIDNIDGVPSMVSRIYSEPGLYYGYPNISWCGLSSDDEQSIITFNHSSQTEPAGFSAIHVNASLEPSARLQIKTGDSYVDVMTDSLERWGDYSGSQRLYDEPGKVWAVGSFGSNLHGHGTWIAELTTPDLLTGIANGEVIHIDASTFPNPFAEQINVVFDIPSTTFLRLELVDMSGRLVKLLMEDRIKAGKNRISFNGAFLENGTYLINAYTKDGLMFNKKVIKQ
ncbi:MAG: T9SS type A sorting domain-containing protein [Flavobacteriales bacterium]|nr:T9SS type A sorting domain-containing protein [Flavobacteriales bacterium]